MQKTINWKQTEIITIIISFVVGIGVHLFGLVNVIHNYDDITVQPFGYGATLESGRWALLLFGKATEKFFGAYNLPWLNGILFLLFTAVTVGILVSVFDIKSRKAAVLLGLVFISFPSAASTLMFKYTAHFYAFAILLSVLAVWFLRKFKYGIIPAAFCIAFSIGIYQAYVPLTICICVLLLIKQLLQEDVPAPALIWRGICDCASFMLGLGLYFLFLKLFLAVFHTSLSDYQGIQNMGKLSLAQIPSLIYRAFRDSCLFPINGYGSLAQTALLKGSYLVLFLISAFLLTYTAFVKKRNPSQILLLVLLCLAFPIAVNFIVIMCPSSAIYTLMVYSFALIPCVPLILMETFPEEKEKLRRFCTSISACIVLIIVVSNAYLTNVNYSSTYYATRQAENYMNSLVTQVRLTEGFTADKKWVPVGTINDPLLKGSWNNVPLYGGIAHSNSLVNAYSWRFWLSSYCGYASMWASDEEIALLSNTEAVKEMPVWPNYGSTKVIDEYIVIKFEEIQNP